MTTAIAVKPLEWSENRKPNDEIRYDHCIADGIFGPVTIEWKSWKDCPGYTVYIADDVLTGDDLDDAKAVAQADYERRILSALTPHGEEAAGQATQTRLVGVTPEAEARDAGITFGIAMSVAFLIRDRDEPSLAREWWDAAGLTIEQCERVGLDDYDLAPIRAALASEASE